MTLYEKRYGRTVGLALALAIVPLLSACESDPVTDLTAERPVLEMLLAPGEAVLPGGGLALGSPRISGFDLTTPDAFDRGEVPLGNFVTVESGCCGPGEAFDIAARFAEQPDDTRLPRPTHEGAAPGDWFGMFNPAWTGVGEGMWDLYGEVTGLKPSTTYTIVLARMATDVRGELDQNQVLLGHRVSQPDSLFFLGGTETGYPNIECNFSDFSDVSASTNPVALGFVVTNDNGAVTVDCIPTAVDDSPWWRNAASETPPGAADSLAFGVNGVNGSVEPGQFNYLLFYEGPIDPANPVPETAPAVRIQLGPDIDASGNAINNAFAPFPAGIVDLATFRSLPGGANAFAAPAEITVDVSGLPALPSGTYALWLHNSETNTFQFVSTIDSPGATEEIELVLGDDEEIDFGAFNTLVISIEEGAPGASPSPARILWKTYLTPSLALEEGALAFGTFDPEESRLFQVAGAGEGQFVGDSLIVRLNRLSRPPTGFHYQSYMLRVSATGEIEAQQRLHTVALNELGNARDAVGEDEVGSFASYNSYVVVLEPDAAPSFTPAMIQVSENWLDKFSDFFTTPEG